MGNNEIIKRFKASNKAYKGIGDYKWTFLLCLLLSFALKTCTLQKEWYNIIRIKFT